MNKKTLYVNIYGIITRFLSLFRATTLLVDAGGITTRDYSRRSIRTFVTDCESCKNRYKVKLLIDAGGNVNYVKTDTDSSPCYE